MVTTTLQRNAVMNDTQDTPEIAKEWRLEHRSLISRVFDSAERSLESEVCCIFHGDDKPRSHANAHLIAAAPDLLEAARAALAYDAAISRRGFMGTNLKPAPGLPGALAEGDDL